MSRVAMYRELNDRAQYWVALADFDAQYQSLPAYANDGRALRFVRIDNQPSGQFALFEGSTEELRKVKEIEQNPEKVTALFEAHLKTLSNPITLITYRGGAGPFTDRGRVLARFDKAIKSKDLGTASTALQEYARLTDGRKETPLPPEVIQADPPDLNAPVREISGNTDKGDGPSKFPWLAVAAGAAAILLVASSGTDSGEDGY